MTIKMLQFFFISDTVFERFPAIRQKFFFCLFFFLFFLCVCAVALVISLFMVSFPNQLQMLIIPHSAVLFFKAFFYIFGYYGLQFILYLVISEAAIMKNWALNLYFLCKYLKKFDNDRKLIFYKIQKELT